jgi:DNA repair ATPase RecN
MPTQEERLTSLEQSVESLQKEVSMLPGQEKRITALEQRTASAIQEIEENTTIMLGVLRSQGQDIRKIFQRLDSVEAKLTHLDSMEATLDEHTRQLTQHTGLLNQHTELLTQHTGLLNQHTELLTQILARLPEKPR